MIAHYENPPGGQPPADALAALARALDLSADEVLGLAPLSESVNSADRLRRRLRKVEELPADDQRTVVKLVDALATSREVRDSSSKGTRARAMWAVQGRAIPTPSV